jgi:cytochrome c biogenesis protein CcdA
MGSQKRWRFGLFIYDGVVFRGRLDALHWHDPGSDPDTWDEPAIGLGMDRAANWIMRFKRYIRTVEIFSGILMIAIGVLILSDGMNQIAIWALRNGYYLDLPLGGAATPTYFVAILAGLISFLSPCVLPLVPAYVGYLSGQAVRNQ